MSGKQSFVVVLEESSFSENEVTGYLLFLQFNMRILYFTSPDFKSSTLVSVIFPPNILNHFFVVCVLVVSYVNFLEQLIFQITHISITFVAVQYQCTKHSSNTKFFGTFK